MKLEPLLKQAYFTPDEIKLSILLEKIIFAHNQRVYPGEKQNGATINDIKKGLYNAGSEATEEQAIDLLNRLSNLTISNRPVPVIVQVYRKWYSNCI